jgi:hypothetical protein
MSGPAHTSQHKPAEAGTPSPDHIDHESGVSGSLGKDASQTEADDQANFAAQIDALLASAQLDESENPISPPPAEPDPQNAISSESSGAGLQQGTQGSSNSQPPPAPSPSVTQQPSPTSKFPQATLDG